MLIVYKHTNIRTNKSYIGWTVKTMERRWASHLCATRHGSRSMFHNALRKYGEEAWVHEILGEFCTEAEAKEAEVRFIREHLTYAFEHPDTGYNMTLGGEGFTSEQAQRCNKTRVVSITTRMKMSRTHRKSKQKQVRLKIHVHTDEHELNRLAACKRFRERKDIRKMNAEKMKKQTIIFVVGPDRCGKSNIVRALGEELGIDTFKSSTERELFVEQQDRFVNELRYAAPFFCDFLFQTNISVIFDRGYPCERVYSEFFNRQTDFKVLRFLDEKYAKIHAKILICTRKSFVGIQDDLDPSLDEIALTRISDLYADFAQWTKCKTYTLYVDDCNLQRQIADIRKNLEV